MSAVLLGAAIALTALSVLLLVVAIRTGKRARIASAAGDHRQAVHLHTLAAYRGLMTTGVSLLASLLAVLS